MGPVFQREAYSSYNCIICILLLTKILLTTGSSRTPHGVWYSPACCDNSYAKHSPKRGFHSQICYTTILKSSVVPQPSWFTIKNLFLLPERLLSPTPTRADSDRAGKFGAWTPCSIRSSGLSRSCSSLVNSNIIAAKVYFSFGKSYAATEIFHTNCN